MRQTLVLIPHEIAGIPVLGIGWLLLLIIAGLMVRAALARRRGGSITELLGGEGLMWGIAAVAVAFIFPMIERTNVLGEPVGMAIRGYGVMLLLGVSAAVVLAAYRAKRRGIDPEIIYAVAPWALCGGILGARVFFVIQYFDEFVGATTWQTIRNMLNFTEGGLVVYGSFIGGFIAVAYFILRHRLPLLTFGDVIVPCMFIGVFFGRIGCLMNGCCYGGRCEDHWAAIEFPPGSPVYVEQLESGELLGFSVDSQSRQIESVRKESLASEAGIVPGSELESIARDYSARENASPTIPLEDIRTGAVAMIDGRRYRWTPDQLPDQALPVFAAQVLSSVSSLLLCSLLCALSLLRLRTGTIMMIGFASYAIMRFWLEWVRVDEAGRFGTGLSISQLVSLVVFTLSIAGLIWLYRRPSASATLPAQASA